MQDQGQGTYEPGAPPAPVDHLVEERTGVRPAMFRPEPASGVRVGENMMTVRDRLRWGPILGGILTTAAVMLVLTALGLAIGLSAFKPNTSATDWGTGAAIWGGITAIISFFVGGWVAAKTAAVGGPGSGLLNGFVTGAATLVLVVWLATTGITNLVGYVGNNVAAIAAVTSNTARATGNTQQATNTAQNAANQVQQAATNPSNQQTAYNDAKSGAWGTFVVFLLFLIAAALGGLVGYNKRETLISGSAAG